MHTYLNNSKCISNSIVLGFISITINDAFTSFQQARVTIWKLHSRRIYVVHVPSYSTVVKTIISVLQLNTSKCYSESSLFTTDLRRANEMRPLSKVIDDGFTSSLTNAFSIELNCSTDELTL